MANDPRLGVKSAAAYETKAVTVSVILSDNEAEVTYPDGSIETYKLDDFNDNFISK